MSDVKFTSALNSLQNQPDNASLLKILVTIRREVEWPKNKDNITTLRERGCLKQIVGSLQSTQKNILDVSLSILGNVFMCHVCTREVVTYCNILSYLNQLLKRFSKEDSINGRVFRVIGNICQHKEQWANMIIDRKPQMIVSIIDFVKRNSKDSLPDDEKVSEATIMMAVRSLRSLLNAQTVISLVRSFGVLKAMGALFIKYSLEWQKSKKHENILNNIIRLLQEYSRFKYYHSIMEMRNTERGDSLIHLSNVLLLAPRRIVKIVMNFIRICQLKSELPIPEICDRFIDILQNHSIIKEFNGECVEYLQCLCYLLEHPANRNSERCGKCLPLLVKALKDFIEPNNTSLECSILLIASLNKCKYDDRLMQEQLRCNIINILLEKLNWLVGTSIELNTDHKDQKKRKYKFGGTPPISNKKFGITYEELKEPKSPSSSDDEYDYSLMKFDRSPSPSSSCDSDMNLYPWSSPSSSNHSYMHDISESDSDDYSPVCSEADSTDFPLPGDEENPQVPSEPDRTSDIPECDEETNNSDISSDKNTTNLKIRLLTEILKLLKSYIKLKPSIQQLATPELLIKLLKCSGSFEWQHNFSIDAIDVICRILDSHDYLIPLLQTDFVQTIYNLTEYQHDPWCAKCVQYSHVGNTILRKLSNLAESGIGKGDIAHKLLRGDSQIRQQLVLVIPYVVRNRPILGKLMLNCGGLEILMKLLREDSEMKKRCIKVLCAMATRKLSIANPRKILEDENTMNRPKIVADKYKLDENTENVVTLKLDDGTELKADREFLSAKSDFFSRLFNGSFKESTEDEITLQNVELKSLRCLLHLLKSIDKNESIEIDLDLDTLLDVIVLSDRYLLTDLCLSLTDSVEQFRISSETVPIIYNWSIESGTNLLRIESIAFAMVANIIDAERFTMFENLFSLGYSEQLLDDIQRLLIRYLSIHEIDCDRQQKQLRVRLKRMKENLLKSYLE